MKKALWLWFIVAMSKLIIRDWRERYRLRKTVSFMKKAHKGQVDKIGEPYYLHPLSVMQLLQEPTSNSLKMTAILHDVMEYSSCTDSKLRKIGMSEEVINSIQILTRKDGEVYSDYIRRIIDSGDANAIKVKIADAMDNLYPIRLNMLPDENSGLEFRYKRSLQMLQDALRNLR